MKKYLIILAVLVVVGGAAVLIFRYRAPVANGPVVETPVSSPSPVSLPPQGAVVRYTDAGGFTPSIIRIRVGESVMFINAGTRPVWPASAIHPTHQVYPGSDIKKCGTPDQATIFDACHGIPPGGSWSFTFLSPGTWKYHDHLEPSAVGTVEVLAQ